MMTLDEVIKRHEKELKELINKFKEEIDNNNFWIVYNNLHHPIISPAFTALLLKNKINPLEYMDTVPAFFAHNLSIEKLVIADNITTMDAFAFSGCTNLTNIEIPESVTNISSFMFQNCTSLTSIIIPKNVTRIKNNTFQGCGSLVSITIPKNVTSIGTRAFSGCSKLKDVYYEGSEEDWKNIKIEPSNRYLVNATIHHNS